MDKPQKGLIIKKEWLELILSGKKIVEIRSSHTKVRGKIALIESGSGHIVGECEIIDSTCLDTAEKLDKAMIDGCVSKDVVLVSYYKKPHAWHIKNAIRYEKPVPYKHPKGAVIWVNIN